MSWWQLLGGLLENFGAIAGLWGILWMLWDHRARAPEWLLGWALVFLIAGSAIT